MTVLTKRCSKVSFFNIGSDKLQCFLLCTHIINGAMAIIEFITVIRSKDKLTSYGTQLLKMNIQKVDASIFWSIWGGGFYYMIEIWFKEMVLFTAPLKEAKRDKLIMLSFAFISSGLVFYFGASSIPGVFDIGTGLWMFTKVCLIPFYRLELFYRDYGLRTSYSFGDSLENERRVDSVLWTNERNCQLPYQSDYEFFLP